MCGIVGIYTPGRDNASDQASLALFAEQHRGQESCGIAWADGDRLRATGEAVRLEAGQVEDPGHGALHPSGEVPHSVQPDAMRSRVASSTPAARACVANSEARARSCHRPDHQATASGVA